MHPVVGRTVASLAASFALMWAGMSLVAGPGSQALVTLTGNLSHAGIFVALIYVGAAAAAAVAGRLMDRVGRRPVLAAAHLLGGLGYLAAGRGVAIGSTGLFLAGTATFAMAFGAGNLTRVAVAEMFPPAIRGRGIATVQLSAIFGAVAGPLLLLGSVPLAKVLGQSPLVLVWYVAPPLLVVAALVTLRAAEPLSIAKDLAKYHPGVPAAPPPTTTNTGRWVLLAGGLALAASHGAMAALMGVAGAAVAHAGLGTRTLGFLMLAHFVGMFGLSRQVGTVADRFGRRNTMLAGLCILALGGAVMAVEAGAIGFGIGLLLAGVGWSFGFIGGTVLLTDAVAPARRARVIGRADLVAQLGAAGVATAGGYWFAHHGMAALGGFAAGLSLVAAIGVVLLLRERGAGRVVAEPA
jgi:MFS family permease